MADSKKGKRPERLEDVETEPGAWERFERAVDAALHTPPKQRPKREREAPADGCAKPPKPSR